MGMMIRGSWLLLASMAMACTPHSFKETIVPSVPLSPAYSGQNAQSLSAELKNPWWQSLARPTLTQLIEDALTNNQTIQQAVAALKQAEAVSIQTQSDRLPNLTADGSIGKQWYGSDGLRTTQNLGVDLSWELDIVNRIGAQLRSDRLTTQARAEEVDAVKLALSADVAVAYFSAVAAHRKIALLREQLQLDRELETLLELRLKNGVGTRVDVLRQRARVADSQTLIPLAEADLAVAENRLDVLLGIAPDGNSRVPVTDTLNFNNDLPALGIPAGLLLNRPDLRILQAELFAADADIAVAIADRLPQVTLDLSYGYSKTQTLSNPVSMVMASFVQPLLDWGKRKAAVAGKKALYEEKLAEFTYAYLEAVEAVENALIREEKQREFLKRLAIQRQTLQETAESSEDRYTQGVDDYLPVIDALQELRDVERSEITEQLALVTNRIALFRAIGGPIHALTQKEAVK